MYCTYRLLAACSSSSIDLTPLGLDMVGPQRFMGSSDESHLVWGLIIDAHRPWMPFLVFSKLLKDLAIKNIITITYTRRS